jgi:hypothetical protein
MNTTNDRPKPSLGPTCRHIGLWYIDDLGPLEVANRELSY